jgi:hypothetical protein
VLLLLLWLLLLLAGPIAFAATIPTARAEAEWAKSTGTDGDARVYES